MSEKFNLKWNDFQSVVSQSFSVLRREEDFFDVTLVSDDEIQISAHKLVLSACSGFFKSILKRNSHSHPLLYLSGVDSKSLGFVLDYIYHGEVQVYQHELDLFLDIAQKLKIKGLESEDREEPHIQKEEYYKESSSLVDAKDESTTDISKEKIVALTDMSAADETIKALLEKIRGGHRCRVCDHFNKDRRDAMEHVEKHIEGLSYSCQFCDRTFRRKRSLRSHVTSQHNSFL